MGAWANRGAVHPRLGKSDLGPDPPYPGSHHRREGAHCSHSVRCGLCRRPLEHRLGGVDGQTAARAARGRPYGAQENVGDARKSGSRAWFSSSTRGGGAAQRRAMVPAARSRPMKILVVASEPWELRGILSRCSDVRKPPVKADWARSGLMREHELLLVANGAGTKRAGEGLDAALAVFSPDTLASTGLCGALSPDLGPTEIIVATAVIAGNAGYPAMPVDCARR